MVRPCRPVARHSASQRLHAAWRGVLVAFFCFHRSDRNEEPFMNPVQRAGFDNEIALAKERIAKGELDAGFSHLERAHIIGQAFVAPHATSHWLMLRVEFRRRRVFAVFGQTARIALGILGSIVGLVPIGNTGGTNISMFRRLPIEPELQNIIDGVQPNPRA